MQRAPNVTRLPFRVEALRDRFRVGVHLDDRVDRRPGLVERFDTREVVIDEIERAQLIARHRRLHLRDGHLVEVRWRRRRRQASHDRQRRRPRHRPRAELQDIAPAELRVPHCPHLATSSWLTHDHMTTSR